MTIEKPEAPEKGPEKPKGLGKNLDEQIDNAEDELRRTMEEAQKLAGPPETKSPKRKKINLLDALGDSESNESFNNKNLESNETIKVGEQEFQKGITELLNEHYQGKKKGAINRVISSEFTKRDLRYRQAYDAIKNNSKYEDNLSEMKKDKEVLGYLQYLIPRIDSY